MTNPLAALKKDLLLGLTLRGLGAISSFGFTWLIANQFGARILGLYQLGFTTTTLLATIATIGLDVILVREVSSIIQEGKTAQVAAVFHKVRQLVLRFGLAMMLLSVALAIPLAVYAFDEPAAAAYLFALAPLVVLTPMLKVQNALIRSFGLTKISQSLEGVLYTSFALVALLVITQAAGWFEPLLIPVVMVAGVVICVFVGARVSASRLIASTKTHADLSVRDGAFVAGPAIMGAISGWLITLLISQHLSTSDVGVFRVAIQVCLLMQLINASFATMAGPYLSRAATARDLALLRKITLIAGSIGLLISSPVAAAALLAPDWIMQLFGPEFFGGASALQVLVIGQLIDVAAGPVGVAMIMQGRERFVFAVLMIATLIAVTLAYLLIPPLGLTGAAIGMVALSAIRNTANWIMIQFFPPKVQAAKTSQPTD